MAGVYPTYGTPAQGGIYGLAQHAYQGPVGYLGHHHHQYHLDYKAALEETDRLRLVMGDADQHYHERLEKNEDEFQELAQEAARDRAAANKAKKEAEKCRQRAETAEAEAAKQAQKAARVQAILDNRLIPAETENVQMKKKVEAQRVAYNRLDKELTRLTGVEVDLATAKVQLDDASAIIQETEAEAMEVEAAFYEQEQMRVDAEGQRKAARNEAIEALQQSNTVSKERDTWRHQYDQATAMMEEAEMRAEEAHAEATELRAALEAAMHNSHYVKETQAQLQASHSQLAEENNELEDAVAEEYDVREHAERAAKASEDDALRARDELSSLQGAANQLQGAYRQLASDKTGMERRLGAELAATLSKLEVCEAEKNALEVKLLEATKQAALRPSVSSAFTELDNVLKTVDATREGIRGGETVRYEVVGDTVQTTKWSLGSNAAIKAAEQWAAKGQSARELCAIVGQELAYGTSARF